MIAFKYIFKLRNKFSVLGMSIQHRKKLVKKSKKIIECVLKNLNKTLSFDVFFPQKTELYHIMLILLITFLNKIRGYSLYEKGQLYISF